MNDCVFCRIVRGEIPVRVVWEDENVLAFDDVSPQSPVHTLVIPKQHFEHLGEGIPADTLAALFFAVPLVAQAKGVSASGYRVIINNGPDANQTVEHLHVHVMGGRPMSHGMVRFSDEG